MKILVVDDEGLAVEGLVKLLCKVRPEAEIVSFLKPVEAFEYLTAHVVDVAFLDIEMGELSGLALAKKCKDLCHSINIIFVTGYSEYTMDALKLHVSGYLMKPVRAQDLQTELDHLRHPVRHSDKRVRIQTFGGFDIFVDGAVVSFGRAKAKEVLAYLVNKKGLSCTSKEIAAILWEDEPYDFAKQRYFQTIIASLMTTLKDVGVEDIIIRKHNSLAVNVTKFDCDFYNFQKGDIHAVNSYTGEYMTGYSWAEFTVGYLDQIKPN